MSTNEKINIDIKGIVANLVNTLIDATGKGSIPWKLSAYRPKNLEPLTRIMECYEGEWGNTKYYIYKSIREPQQRGLLNPPSPTENILELQPAKAVEPFRVPYVPKTDELILAAARKALEEQNSELSKLLKELTKNK